MKKSRLLCSSIPTASF